MTKIRRFTLLSLIGCLLTVFFGGCSTDKGSEPIAYYTDYREFPGITQQDIEEIEALRENYNQIVFGLNFSTEAFYYEDGQIGGFYNFLCEWMTELFDIPFVPVIAEWDDILSGILSHEIHMTSELTPTPERRETFFMTDPITEYNLKEYRLLNSESYESIAYRTKPVFGFLNGSTSYTMVMNNTDISFAPYFMDNCEEAAEAILSGRIDAFFENSPSEAYFYSYPDIMSKNYNPLQYQPSCLSTADPGIKPIIDVMQLYFQNADTFQYHELKDKGDLEYKRYVFQTFLTQDEREYIQQHQQSQKTIPMAVQCFNYPSSFYNEQEQELQGIAIDVLKEVENISGLSFDAINESDARFTQNLALVESGEAAFISELIYTKPRSDLFLWSSIPYSTDNYALLSRSETENISISRILFSKVGLIENSGYAQAFLEWFPDHSHYNYYTTVTEGFDALENGEIDFLMATNNLLLSMTNYNEKPLFKINILFDYSYDSLFGFHPDEELLVSIIDKAQRLVDTDFISDNWKQKVFDYRRKVAQQRIPLLLGGVLSLSIVLAFALFMMIKYLRISRNLEGTVQERTRELKVQTEAAQIASKTKSEFLARMSHEIRTPLSAVIGMAQVAKKNVDNPSKSVEAVDQIIASSSHLLGILNDVLDISKIEVGKFHLAHEAFNLHTAIEEVKLIFDQRCHDLSLRFEYNCAGLSKANVMGDKLRLKQVLINLLGNAIKFTDSYVLFKITETAKNNNTISVEFLVVDDGIGMTEEQMEHLFIAFEQADRNISTLYGGTGLGLAISQNLIHQMGGEITATSSPGKGSTFSFSLCMEFAADMDTPEIAVLDVTPDLGNRHILLVEDIEINRLILKELLSETHVKITEAQDGIEALEIFSDSAPQAFDLIFMDIQMPQMDGYETTALIRKTNRSDAGTIPIIALTANAYQEDIDKALSAGMDGHLAKPLDMKQVLGVLNKYLGKNQN